MLDSHQQDPWLSPPQPQADGQHVSQYQLVAIIERSFQQTHLRLLQPADKT